MSDKKRLFLLDAFALIFRGYYAFIKNPRINSKGLDTSAILGFTNSLLDVIKRERPDHLAVCFDKGGSVDRVEAFPAYKANRQETPEAIRLAVPYIESILKAMRISNLSGLNVSGMTQRFSLPNLQGASDHSYYKDPSGDLWLKFVATGTSKSTTISWN